MVVCTSKIEFNPTQSLIVQVLVVSGPFYRDTDLSAGLNSNVPAFRGLAFDVATFHGQTLMELVSAEK